MSFHSRMCPTCKCHFDSERWEYYCSLYCAKMAGRDSAYGPYADNVKIVVVVDGHTEEKVVPERTITTLDKF